MSSFAQDFPDQALMTVLADDITYTSQQVGAVPQLVDAVVDIDVQVGEYVSETQHQIEFLTELLNYAPQQGDVVTYELQNYSLELRLSNDGKYQRWSMKNA